MAREKGAKDEKDGKESIFGQLIPIKEEIDKWLISTLRHSCHVMFLRENLNICNEDPDLPHDIVGRYNKFEWGILRRLSLQYKDNSHMPQYLKGLIQYRVDEAVDKHRTQHHHRMWNRPNIFATTDDLKFGALDTICTLMDDRPYQKRYGLDELIENVYDIIIGVTEQDRIMKTIWVKDLLPNIKEIGQPDLSSITSIYSFPNIGILPLYYDQIRIRVDETIAMLNLKGYGF